MTKGSVLVIGIVGGIGSGKSEVARALGRLGCVVTDSDAQAKEILRRDEVRNQLVQWWGPGVLDDSGHVNRAAVARIIFHDEDARRNLESVVHPLIHRDRAALIAKAAADGVKAVVIDAPLLFEAGVDRECDAVIFVDAPWPVRLERVMRTRGWDEAELRRREAAQLSLDEKKARSTFVVQNAGAPAEVEPQAKRILEALLRGPRKQDHGNAEREPDRSPAV